MKNSLSVLYGPEPLIEACGVEDTSVAYFDFKKDDFQDLYGKIKNITYGSRHSKKACNKNVYQFYKCHSPWKDFDREQRIEKLVESAVSIEKKLKSEGALNSCKKAFVDKIKKDAARKVDKFSQRIIYSTFKDLGLKKTSVYDNESLLEEDNLKNYISMYLINLLDQGKKKLESGVDLRKIESSPDAESLDDMVKRLKKVITRSGKFNAFRFEGQMKRLAKDFFNLKIDYNLNKRVSFLNTDNIEVSLNKANSLNRWSTMGFCNEIVQKYKNDNPGQVSEDVEKFFYSHRKSSTDGLIRRAYDPDVISKSMTPEVALCLIKQETNTTDFDPLTLNYTFCERRWRRNGNPTSTAIGVLQMVEKTFSETRDKGYLPIRSVDSRDGEDNEKLFRRLYESPQMQMEGLYRYLNNRIKSLGLRRGIISYDQDNKRTYVKNVLNCRQCIINKKKKIGISDAAKRCLGVKTAIPKSYRDLKCN